MSFLFRRSVIASVELLLMGCHASQTKRNGPLAALADSALFSASSSVVCIRVEDQPLANNDRLLLCGARVADTAVSVVSIAVDGFVLRVVCTWGDRTATAFAIDTTLARRFSQRYGRVDTVYRAPDSTRGLKWHTAHGGILLVPTGRGSEQQTIFMADTARLNR